MKRLRGVEIIDVIAFLITLIVLFLAVSGSISGYVRPHHFRWVAAANNIMPYTLFCSIFLILYWIIRRSWGFLIPLFSILINIYTLLSLVQFRAEKNFFSANKEGVIKVFNYNAKEFNNQSDADLLNDISKFILEETPDIICFQEYKNIPYPTPEVMNNYFDNIPFRYIEYPDVKHKGMAILTKYKIIGKGLLNFGDSENRAVWVDLASDRGTIRVVNLQLKMNRLADKGSKEENLFGMVSSLMDNNEKRAAQADELRHFIDTTVHPVIVCGDMNDTPSSYSYTMIKGEKLVDGFREAGSRLGGTHKGMSGLLRIDYIFHSKDFLSSRYRTLDNEWGDHRPVISELEYQN